MTRLTTLCLQVMLSTCNCDLDFWIRNQQIKDIEATLSANGLSPDNVLNSRQCTLYTVHCTLYTANCTLYTVHCTLYTVHRTPYTVHCTLDTGPAPGGLGGNSTVGADNSLLSPQQVLYNSVYTWHTFAHTRYCTILFICRYLCTHQVLYNSVYTKHTYVHTRYCTI